MRSSAERHPPLRSITLLLTALLVTGGGCSRHAVSLFFDLPASSVKPTAPAARPVTVVDTARKPAAVEPPPVFEASLDPDTAIARLPRDHAGNIDWQAAVQLGVIRPRSTLPGRPIPDSLGFRFKFDFYFPGPDTTFDAFFPHSTHTEWVDCQHCHARIFRYRGTPIKMADVLQGKYCAECHGKVSYPVATGCERCHTRIKLPPDRAKPELIGTLTLHRVKPDSVNGVVEGNAAGVNTAALPNARFPHWVHRSRFRCKVCHMELFEPRNGANQVTMKLIAEGKACGACHNGKTAFASGFGQCERCHVPAKPAAQGAANAANR